MIEREEAKAKADPSYIYRRILMMKVKLYSYDQLHPTLQYALSALALVIYYYLCAPMLYLWKWCIISGLLPPSFLSSLGLFTFRLIHTIESHSSLRLALRISGILLSIITWLPLSCLLLVNHLIYSPLCKLILAWLLPPFDLSGR